MKYSKKHTLVQVKLETGADVIFRALRKPAYHSDSTLPFWGVQKMIWIGVYIPNSLFQRSVPSTTRSPWTFSFLCLYKRTVLYRVSKVIRSSESLRCKVQGYRNGDIVASETEGLIMTGQDVVFNTFLYPSRVMSMTDHSCSVMLRFILSPLWKMRSVQFAELLFSHCKKNTGENAWYDSPLDHQSKAVVFIEFSTPETGNISWWSWRFSQTAPKLFSLVGSSNK